jgi:hypothetical protein
MSRPFAQKNRKQLPMRRPAPGRTLLRSRRGSVVPRQTHHRWTDGGAVVRKVLPVLAVALVLSGCYHATVHTGRPSAAQRDSKWAHGFLWGLVPPSPVNATQSCPGGASMVETQLSVPNQLVSWITLGIYSPMTITVTCAQPGN